MLNGPGVLTRPDGVQELGRGTFGVCFLATERSSEARCAIKDTPWLSLHVLVGMLVADLSIGWGVEVIWGVGVEVIACGAGQEDMSQAVKATAVPLQPRPQIAVMTMDCVKGGEDVESSQEPSHRESAQGPAPANPDRIVCGLSFIR